MMKQMLLVAAAAVLLIGCAAPVKLITPPTEPLEPYKQFVILSMKNDVIGTIDERVMQKIMTETVTRVQDLDYFTAVIVDDAVTVDAELLSSGKVVRRSAFTGDAAATAEMTVTLTDYDEGSALLRFFFAPFAGMGKVGCDVVFVNGGSKKELLKVRTVASIGGIAPGAEQVVTPISKALANTVERFFKLKRTK